MSTERLELVTRSLNLEEVIAYPVTSGPVAEKLCHKAKLRRPMLSHEENGRLEVAKAILSEHHDYPKTTIGYLGCIGITADMFPVEVELPATVSESIPLRLVA